jgi:hypothetical protein
MMPAYQVTAVPETSVSMDSSVQVKPQLEFISSSNGDVGLPEPLVVYQPVTVRVLKNYQVVHKGKVYQTADGPFVVDADPTTKRWVQFGWAERVKETVADPPPSASRKKRS